MTNTEFQDSLDELGLSQAEAAKLLSVSARTVRRWVEDGGEIPGPVEQALRAWKRMNTLGLAWRPDGMTIGEDDPEEIAALIARCREHVIELDALLQRVEARGGPAAPWQVDLKKRRATLGPIAISFYPLVGGSFSPSHYRRSDMHNDLERDWSLLEDAFACIAAATGEAGPNWAKD